MDSESIEAATLEGIYSPSVLRFPQSSNEERGPRRLRLPRRVAVVSTCGRGKVVGGGGAGWQKKREQRKGRAGKFYPRKRKREWRNGERERVPGGRKLERWKELIYISIINGAESGSVEATARLVYSVACCIMITRVVQSMPLKVKFG